MTSLLLDTHVWAWVVKGHNNLSPAARAAIDSASLVYVSVISFYEIAQKVRLGKWPDMAPFVFDLEAELEVQGSLNAPLTTAIAAMAGRLDWPHRDPFDRMLAATAITMGLILISADTVFDGLPLRRVW